MKRNRGYSERTSTDQNYNDGKITESMNIHESIMLVFETESLRGKESKKQKTYLSTSLEITIQPKPSFENM